MPILVLLATVFLASCVAPQGDTGNAAQNAVRSQSARDAMNATNNVQRGGLR